MVSKSRQQWFIRRGREMRGPFSTEVVARYRLLGRIRDTDELSNDKLHWQPADSVPAINPNRVARETKPQAREHLEATEKFAERHHLSIEEQAEHYERRFRKQVNPLVRIGQYAVVLALAVLMMALPFVVPQGNDVTEPQCDAQPAPGINWRNCRLSRKDFANSDLNDAMLQAANLSRAVLQASNLSGADASYADFSRANLRATNFSGAKLVGASFVSANLTSADLRNADLSHADLRSADLRQVHLAGARLDNAVWAEGIFCMPGSVGECRKARR